MTRTARLVFAFAVLLLGLCTAQAAEVSTLMPNGDRFLPWDGSQQFSATYHVAQLDAKASDDNPGTEDLPWKTIGKAAATLQPGERVIVHQGVYREWVKPARGGTGRDAVISYEAAPGEAVVLKGSDEWKPRWTKHKDKTWSASLSPDMFPGENVFALVNFPPQKDANTWKQFPSFELCRGQLFVDGLPLIQAPTRKLAAKQTGRFWVAEDRLTLYVRLPHDCNPNLKTFEVTTREQVFAPQTPYLNFICVKGFRMFHAANGVPVPPPQRGLLSATGGHHWLIEGCEIGYANTIGIDLGSQLDHMKNDQYGHHVVRGNYIHHCGVSAVCAWPAWDVGYNVANLLEDNLFADNAWMPVTRHYESASVKMHSTHDVLVQRNVFLRTGHSASLWFDGSVFNCRFTRNFFYDARDPDGLGSAIMEINQGFNLVDNNVFWGSADHGFHQHDAERITIAQNLFANVKGYGVHLSKGDPSRCNPPWENYHRVYGSIFANCGHYIQRCNGTSLTDDNVFGSVGTDPSKAFASYDKAEKPADYTLDQWQAMGEDRHSTFAPVEASLNLASMTLRMKTGGLPTYGEFPSPMDDVAPFSRVLREDFLGQKRPADSFQPGPFLDYPDNKEVSVDPRSEEARKSFPVPVTPEIDLSEEYARIYP